ncbi:hypothetical protein U5801_19810 [Lamprobacter modestohalophilus]|uniref:hypothetical protein n=1 Tax=Lamprobacter modestohalophilus TaxID=1064514 RepID=UPI002ADECE87|nr:hypothetical protein [Lamprobacter modestohalophilus]MEA1052035.1 hypothetical protein [Lamprobacter modestohalophilus]
MVTTGPEGLHAAAPHHLPFFITAPGSSDGLMTTTGIFLLLAVIGIGVLYFRLHALPEQMAHRGQKVQFELVAVLALLALFTHNHTFWVAGLLLALVPLPDITTPLSKIAGSLDKIANQQAPRAAASEQTGTPHDPVAVEEPDAPGSLSSDSADIASPESSGNEPRS